MGKYKYNTNYFELIDTEDKAYWLGFLYADGSINRFYKNNKKENGIRSMTLEISLAEKDREHLEKFKQCIESDIPIFKRTIQLGDKKYGAVRIQLNNTKICRDLCNLGCVPAKTYIVRMPSFDIVPKKFMRDFLRGFFDGDGCICTEPVDGKPHIILNITGMSEMLKDFSDFLISEGVIRKVPKIYKDKRNNAYKVYFYGTDSNKELLDYLYKDSSVYLDRKYNKYIDFYKNYDDKAQKRGVYYSKMNNAYIATIYINGEHIRIGQYKNIDDAIDARKKAEVEKMKLQKPA